MAISMDPVPIKRAGDDLAQVAATAAARARNLLHSSTEAAEGNPGWRSAAALHELRQAWEQHVTTLIADTEKAAQSLRDSAGMVAASDQEGDRRLRRVLHDIAEE